MEILSIVIDGELSHHGDQAHGATLKPREAQLISARDGIQHAEGNETNAATRMLQIWFTPNERGGAPAYYHRQLREEVGLQVIAGDGSMPLRADAKIWWLDVAPGREQRITLGAKRAGYLLALNAPLRLNHASVLAPGDGVEVGEGELVVNAPSRASAIWIEIPASGISSK
jgi:hypothetical protein